MGSTTGLDSPSDWSVSIVKDNATIASTLNDATVHLPTPDPPAVPSNDAQVTSSLRFWLIIVALMVSEFLSALDLTCVPTALPTIVDELHGTNFVWVGSAFTLGSTAVIPMTGGLAQSFGRRPIVLGSLVFFALGSAICGAASSMNMLIVGRAIQGIGSGGVMSLSDIVVADLVPLKDRGTYVGILGSVWAVASAIGPPIGGAFAQKNWRWLFYLNLPLCGIAITLVFFFLNLKVPKDDFRTKMRRMDWTGTAIIIVCTTITIIALTWAGVEHAWSSYQVLVPLIVGLIGTLGFFYYETKFAKEPLVPLLLVSNRTSFFGYLTSFIHSIVSTTIIYYLPIYFQSTKIQGPVAAGVSMFGNAFTIAPGAILCGVVTTIINIYRPQNLFGWTLSALGTGLLALLKADSPKSQWVGFQIIEGLGLGILFTSPTFPVLAPIDVAENAHALAFLTFLRSYAQTWGITMGGTILQNGLRRKLPEAFLKSLSEASSSVEIAYAAIPTIPGLPEPLRGQVRAAFACSLKEIWIVMAALCVVGGLCVFGMKEIKMHEATDEDWGMELNERRDVEKQLCVPGAHD